MEISAGLGLVDAFTGLGFFDIEAGLALFAVFTGGDLQTLCVTCASFDAEVFFMVLGGTWTFEGLKVPAGMASAAGLFVAAAANDISGVSNNWRILAARLRLRVDAGVAGISDRTANSLFAADETKWLAGAIIGFPPGVL
jgi:hypothetical protein